VHKWAAFLMVLGFVLPAGRGQAQPTPVPDVKPNLAPMMYLIGTWACHSTSPNRPGDRVETDKYALGLDDRWIVETSESKAFDPARTRTIGGTAYITYDAKAKHWVYLGVDNFGFYTMSTSPGWNGNTLTWTEVQTANADPLGTFAVTRDADTKMSFAIETKTPKGTERITGTCTKA
jgi:hypothetical protein